MQETFVRVLRAREHRAPDAGNAARNELRRPCRRSPHAPLDESGDGALLALAAD